MPAKSSLSPLPEVFESDAVPVALNPRNARLAAGLAPVDTPLPLQRIGVAQGEFAVPENIDAGNDEVAQLFVGGGSR